MADSWSAWDYAASYQLFAKKGSPYQGCPKKSIQLTLSRYESMAQPDAF